MKVTVITAVATLLLAATPLLAHHSFTALYNTDQIVTIEGKLTQFMFRNPHSFVHLDVKGEDGQVIRYAIEWAGAGQLTRDGVSSESLRPGDLVVITGNPGRNSSDHRLRMKTLTRTSDGLKWGGSFD